MTTQQAIVIQKPGEAKLSEIPIPKLRPHYVLIKVKAIALNPTDWKHIAFLGKPGHLVGCDYAGIVEEIGEGVTKFKKGDRIAGFAHGANSQNPTDGAFAQYITALEGPAFVIPAPLSFEDASTLGVGITTVGQGLYQSLGLTPHTKPLSSPEPVLIYGGSTATGTLAIQYAKLSGYTVITTASPRNAEFLKGLGADEVVDYNDPDAGKKIRELTGDKLKFAFDCISEAGSNNICGDALSSTGGTYSALLPCKVDRENVVNKGTLGYTAFGEYFTKGPTEFPANRGDYEFASEFWDGARTLFEQGKLKAHPAKVVEGGLGTVLESLEELKSGKASRFKFVHRVD